MFNPHPVMVRWFHREAREERKDFLKIHSATCNAGYSLFDRMVLQCNDFSSLSLYQCCRNGTIHLEWRTFMDSIFAEQTEEK